MKKLEAIFEHFLFASRWLMAPVYLALVITLMVLMVKAGKQLWELVNIVWTADGNTIITGVLSIVDVSLIMNLLIIIIFSGYENFVSKMENLHDHEDRPDWMGHIGFTDLTLKLIGSIVAISGVECKYPRRNPNLLGWGRLVGFSVYSSVDPSARKARRIIRR